MDVHYPTASLPAPLRSELEYEPYVAVLVSIDSDGPQSDSFTAIQGSIEKRLAPLRDLEQRCTAYREDNIVDGTNPKYSHLYKVMDFLPMGHSNTLGFVLLDDFDPVHWITSSCDTTIEEVSLGFCPDIKQLLPTLKGKRPSWTDQCFTSPKGLFESYSSNGNDNIPLLLFTSFKIGGLASLEHGLQSYQAIIKSILSELTRGLRLMEANLESFTEWEVALDDIKMMRICILDLQGQEEIGILFLCNNYTIPMTLVSMLQYLTMAQVFSQAPELEKEWTDTGKKPNFWTAIRKVGKIAGKERIGWDDNKWNERLDSTHVFRWTRSVVAINPSEFYENSCTHVKGHLDYLTELRVPAGHQSGYRDLIPDAIIETNPDPKRFYRMRIGRSDYSFGSSIDPSKPPAARSFFARALELHGRNTTINKPFRHISSVCSILSIPVPMIDTPVNGEAFIVNPDWDKHYSVFGNILPWVKSELRRESDGGVSRFVVLKNSGAYCMMPHSLLRTIEYLFDNFATVMGNPNQFQCVLDLYDVFFTLYDVLTKHLPDSVEEKTTESKCYWIGLSKDHLQKIGDLVQAIQRGMERRLYRAFPDERGREMEIDFRGGLNQLLAAVDSVQKCAAGVVRRYIWERPEKRNCVGVVTAIDYDPGVEMCALDIGIAKKAQIGIVRTDVPHLYHVPSFVDFWHEVFHLGFIALLEGVEKDGTSLDYPFLPGLPGVANHELDHKVASSGLLQERLSEIFVHLLSAMFICPDDPSLMVRHGLIQLAGSAESGGGGKEEVILRWAEYCMHLFVFSDTMREVINTSGEIEPDQLVEVRWSQLQEKWSKNGGEPLADSSHPLHSYWADLILKTTPSEENCQLDRILKMWDDNLHFHWLFCGEVEEEKVALRRFFKLYAKTTFKVSIHFWEPLLSGHLAFTREH